MFMWTAKFSKKKAIVSVLVLGVVLAAVIGVVGRDRAEPAEAPLCHNQDRVAYLKNWGWEVNPEPVETLQFLLPEKLTEPYLSYCDLQESQGFDFAACSGKQVARYTYAVTNYPGRRDGVQVNLYVCDTAAVGGDVFCAGTDGFQATLVYPPQ
ncbi:MAG: DUF4830 domain-containing protein [Oscillibacter sp.]